MTKAATSRTKWSRADVLLVVVSAFIVVAGVAVLFVAPVPLRNDGNEKESRVTVNERVAREKRENTKENDALKLATFSSPGRVFEYPMAYLKLARKPIFPRAMSDVSEHIVTFAFKNDRGLIDTAASTTVSSNVVVSLIDTCRFPTDGEETVVTIGGSEYRMVQQSGTAAGSSYQRLIYFVDHDIYCTIIELQHQIGSPGAVGYTPDTIEEVRRANDRLMAEQRAVVERIMIPSLVRPNERETGRFDVPALNIAWKRIMDDPAQSVSITNHLGQELSPYSMYYYAPGNRALVTAREDGKRGRWNLYVITADGESSVIYHDLITDCCGGGMPTITASDEHEAVAEVSAGTGDVCFYESETIRIDMAQTPVQYVRAARKNSCESFAEGALQTSDVRYRITPMVSADCKDRAGGTPVSVTGLRATSTAGTFVAPFDEPVSMVCEEREFGSYSKSLDLRRVSASLPGRMAFELTVSEDGQIVRRIPMTLSVTEGFHF